MPRYISLDTETSGVDFCSSQVIQCGCIFLDKDMQPVQKKEWNINYKDDFSWSEEAAEVHRIDKEKSRTHGVEPEVFLKELEQEISKYYKDEEVHIIAVNGYFDYLMLQLLWSRYRKDEFILSRRILDLTSLSLTIIGVAGVSSIAEYLGISVDENKAHSALYDAELHLKIFYSLIAISKTEGIVV